MLSISNLQQACEVLSRKTGRAWTDAMLLDFAQHIRLPLAAAAPIDAVPVLYSLRDEDGRVCFKQKVRGPPGSQPLLHLFPWQVMQLLIRGDVMAQHVAWDIHGNLEDSIELIASAVRILPKDVRLKRSALDAVVRSWGESQVRPGPFTEMTGADGIVLQGDARHRWPAWVFDDSQDEGKAIDQRRELDPKEIVKAWKDDEAQAYAAQLFSIEGQGHHDSQDRLLRSIGLWSDQLDTREKTKREVRRKVEPFRPKPATFASGLGARTVPGRNAKKSD